MDRNLAREKLNLPQDKKIILFGAINSTRDSRKGFLFLQLALQKLANTEWKQQIVSCIFGNSKPIKTTDFNMQVYELGHIHDDGKLRILYSAVDVFVAPSTQDNLPNTVVEALACGTPCVAFNIGGMPDIIDHKENGYLAKSFEADDLMQGIIWVIENEERQKLLNYKARQKAEKIFSIESQMQMYIKLYQRLLLKTYLKK